MTYWSNLTLAPTGITNANHTQGPVLNAYLSEPNVIARQAPWSGTTTEVYYGYALPGSNENAEVWRIRKYIITGDTSKNLYPHGDNQYSYSWTLRTTYPYL